MPINKIVPDAKFMARCFELALSGGKQTKSNPNVGCVIVHNNRIIGEGYHAKYGGHHAEIKAINSVPAKLKSKFFESDVYISLEPCSHYGKTPPCAHTLVSSGFKNIIIGCLDINPKVEGKGVKYLEDNGVNVFVPFCEKEALQLILKFKVNLSGLPYIILKWAQSSDHFMGKKNENILLSNEYTRILTHKWRTEVDGILVGKNTVETDNPSLTARAYEGESPVRIVLDNNLELSDSLKMYKDQGQTWTFNSSVTSEVGNKKQFKVSNTKDLESILIELYMNGICSVIVEGGKKVLQSFVEMNLWHEARVIQTKAKLLDGIPSPTLSGSLIKTIKCGSDDVYFIHNTSQ